jgi:hypothetical protein
MVSCGLDKKMLLDQLNSICSVLLVLFDWVMFISCFQLLGWLHLIGVIRFVTLTVSPLGTSATNWPIVLAPDDRWWMCSCRWNENWQGKPKYSEQTSPNATLSTTNPTWPGFEPGPPRWEPAINRLSCGTAKWLVNFTDYLQLISWPQFIVVCIQIKIFWEKTSCDLVDTCHRFRRTYFCIFNVFLSSHLREFISRQTELKSPRVLENLSGSNYQERQK